MRMLMCIIALTLCGFSNDCSAGERGKGVKLKCVTPGEVLLGTGVFLHDTGRNVVGGVHTTLKGLGEVITAPLRAKICVPRPRLFIFEPPTLHYKPAKFYRLIPPASEEPVIRPVPPAPTEGLDFDHPVPLKHIPHNPSKHASFA